MREAVRSQLRAALLIWAAACMALIVGYCAAIAIFVLGVFEGWRSFSANPPTLGGIGPMALGCGSQLLILLLFKGPRALGGSLLANHRRR